MKKIIIVGLYPPSFGGLTVHVQRLCYGLAKRSYEVTLFIVSKEKTEYRTPFRIRSFPNPLLMYLFVLFEKCDVIHDHTSVYYYGYVSGTLYLVPFVIGLWFKKCRWVMSCGDGTLPKRAIYCSRLYRPIYSALFRRIGFAIAKNREILAFFRDHGLQNRSKVVGTFLETHDMGKVPVEVQSFIARHDYVVISSGFMFQSLYNLDEVVRAVGNLKRKHEKYRNSALIILTSQKEDPVGKWHFDIAVKSSLRKTDLLILRDVDYALRVIEKCSICVRVSSYDGDANIIREAMLMKVPVIASDLKDRPQNIVLAPLNQLDKLDQYIHNTLENVFGTMLVENKNRMLRNMEQNFKDILEILTCPSN